MLLEKLTLAGFLWTEQYPADLQWGAHSLQGHLRLVKPLQVTSLQDPLAVVG